MKHISNKNVALIASGPWVIFFVVGIIEGMLDINSLLPVVVEGLLSIIAFVAIIYALVRLYHTPDAGTSVVEIVSPEPQTAASSETPVQN